MLVHNICEKMWRNHKIGFQKCFVSWQRHKHNLILMTNEKSWTSWCSDKRLLWVGRGMNNGIGHMQHLIKDLLWHKKLLVNNFSEEVRQMFWRWNFANLTSASNTFTTLCGKPQEILAENEEQSIGMTICSWLVLILPDVLMISLQM